MLKIGHMLSCLLVVATVSALAEPLPSPARCDLNAPDWDQARCLLSPVRTYGVIGSPKKTLPVPWHKLLGEHPLEVPPAARLTAFLRKAGIREKDVGGALDQPLSRNLPGQGARYFIIHDTSVLLDTPARNGFPAYVNGKAWSDAMIKALAGKKNAHVFVGRTGQSATAVDFGEALVTTKFEKTRRDVLEGLFVGVENLQPRLRDGKGIDSIAPLPGFTRAQLKRLAVVYVAASVRAGRWLIPAFHAVLDSGIPDGHDDPQHFDLPVFSAALNGVLLDMGRATH